MILLVIMKYISDVTLKGFKEPIINDEDYIFGSAQIDGEVLKEDGQWFKPELDEPQNINFETYNCTAFGTTSCLEILFEEKYGVALNWSDRHVGINAGTGRGGNSPHTAAEAVRGEGLVGEEYLPFGGENIDEYYSGLSIDTEIQSQKFLRKFNIRHDWVLTKSSPSNLQARQLLMMEALKYSPLGVSVNAWREDGDIYVNPEEIQDNHWTACIGYKENEYWIIYDSYSPYVKKLAWNFPFQFAKRYHIEEREVVDNWFIDLLKRFGIM